MTYSCHRGTWLLMIVISLASMGRCHSTDEDEDYNYDAQSEMTKNVTTTLNELLNNYDKNIRPDFGSDPVVIKITMNIRSMGPISEKDMIYSFDCYFRQRWTDRRLTFPKYGNYTTLQLNEKMLRQIWKPDTYFINGMGSYLHNITSPNVLFRITNTGEILYSMRLTIKANCPMNLLKFPMDSQICPLVLGSHGYNEEDVLYAWGKGSNSIELAKTMSLSQFDLRETPIGSKTLEVGLRGRYSLLMCQFEFQRHMGYFLIQLYFPCSLLVVLSWVGFWINREATSDRIALGTTTVLTMTFLGMDNRQDLPRVTYSTALDWYVNMCFAFILATIIESASVHYFTKHGSGELHLILESDEEDSHNGGEGIRYAVAAPDKRATMHPQARAELNKTRNGDGEVSGVRSRSETTSISECRHTANTTSHRDRLKGYRPEKYKEGCGHAFLNCLKGSAKYKDMKVRNSTKKINSVSQVDQISRILFPFLFTIFNIGYWSLYLKIL